MRFGRVAPPVVSSLGLGADVVAGAKATTFGTLAKIPTAASARLLDGPDEAQADRDGRRGRKDKVAPAISPDCVIAITTA